MKYEKNYFTVYAYKFKDRPDCGWKPYHEMLTEEKAREVFKHLHYMKIAEIPPKDIPIYRETTIAAAPPSH